MRVLITGGAGFIGSHLAEAYLARGDEVFVLDDLSTGSIDNIRHLQDASPVPLHDRERPPRGRRSPSWSTSATWSFTWRRRSGVRLIVESPVRTIETNVHGTEVVLAQANKKKKKVLIASTSEVYGLSDPGPVPRGRQPGAGADHQGALELRLLEGDRRVPGPGLLARAEAADGHRPAVQHRRPAADGPVRHGRSRRSSSRRSRAGRSRSTATARQSRCFADVGDVVGALIGLMDHPAAVGEVFNIGSSEEVTIRGAGRAGQGADRLPTPRSSRSRTSRPTARASRTCPGACPTSPRSSD